MANGGRIDFTVGYKVDKTGLNEMKKQLEDISKLSATQIQKINPNLNMNEAMSAMQKVRIAIDEIKPALDKSFDTTTGIVNLEKLRNSLQRLDLQEIQKRFNAIGPQGQQAFLNISKAALTTSVRLRETSSVIDKMGQTLINTVKWSFSSSLINRFTGSVQQAWGYVQHLDTSLNDIRIVTGKSADEMERFAVKANDTAKAIGAATTEYTEAALIYYQQGLGDEEANARAETTVKAANVTGQSAQQVSEQLTAVWNGYKVTAEETEQYVDKLAAVAATTASDLEELSTGMSKVASAANNMGVDVDQLNGMLATIISVTRQAPETAGTALKTIFARMEDLKISGEDENGVKLGEVSSTLEELGIEVLDTEGNLRDLGGVIEEVAGKWDTWTKAQQNAAAQAMAGKRQYNNLLALFDNWDMYTSAVQTSQDSLGTLQTQQDIYMESTEAHVQQLKIEWEDLYDSLINTEDINQLIDGLTNVLNLITNILDAIGGGKTLLTGIVALVGTKFSKQIAEAFTPLILNRQNQAYNKEVLSNLKQNIELQQKQGVISGKAAQAMAKEQQTMSQYWSLMSEQEIEADQARIREIGDWETKKEKIEEAKNALVQYTNSLKISKEQKGIFNSDDLFTIGSTANTKGIQFFEEQSQQIQQIQQHYKQLGNTITSVNNKIQAGEISPKMLKGLSTQFVQAKKDVQELQKLAAKGLIPKEVAQNAQKDLSETIQRFKKLKAQVEEVNATEKKLVQAQKELAKAQKGDKNGFIDTNRVNKAKKEVDELTNKLEKLKKELESSTGGYLFTDKMLQALPRINGELDKSSEQYKKSIEALRNLGLSAEEAELHLTELANQQQKTTLELEKRVQGFSQAIGGFTSIVFAIQSLSNIPDILSNDDLTNFQKFSQILSSTLISLPMLISGFNSLAQGISSMGITAKLASSMAVAGTKLSTSAMFENTSAVWANVAAWLGLDAAAAPVLILIAGITAAILALTAVIALNIKAHKDEINAIKESNEALIEVNKQRKEEQQGYEDTANSLQDLVNQYKEGTISIQEFNDQKADLLANLDAQGRAALNISTNWKEATESLIKYKAELAKQQAKEAKENARLGMENALIAADKGIGKYNTSTQTFSNKGARNTAKNVIGALQRVNIAGSGQILGLGYGFVNKGYLESIKQLNKYLEDTKTELSDIVDESGNLQLNMNNPQSIIDFVNAVDKAAQAGIKLDESITKQASEIKQSEGYKTAIEEVESGKTKTETRYGAESGIDLADSLEEGKAAYEKFTSDLIEKEGYTLQEANDAWVKYLSGLDTEVATQMTEVQTNFDTMTSAFSSKFQGNFNDSRFKAEADEILKILENQGLTEGIHLFTPEEWEEMIIGDMSPEQIAQKVREKLNQSVKDGFEAFRESAGENEDNFQSLIEEAISGEVDTTSDDSVYNALKGQLDTLLQYYPELQEEVNIFNNESIIGTQKWTDAVYKLKDAYNDLNFDKLTDRFSEKVQKLHDQVDKMTNYEPEYDDKGNLLNATKMAYDDRGFAKNETEIEVIPDTKQFTETISDIMDADYSINVEIQSDISDNFDNVVSSMENMDKMAEKIGEDFIVSAEDITEIAAAYPGILEGYTDLGNGTIQLNQDIAKSAMDAANQSEIASTEDLVNEVKNTNAKLELKKNHYKTIQKIATDASKGTIKAQEAETKIATELDEIETINNDLKSEEVENNAADVADNSALNAGVVSDNWGKAYDNMASDAIKAAEVAIAAAKEVAKGPDGNVSGLNPKVSVNWSGGKSGNQSSIDTSTPEYKQADGQSNEDYFKQIADEAQRQIDAITEQQAANEAMAVEAAARLGKSVTNNTQVGQKKDNKSGSSSSSKEDKPDTEKYLEREKDAYREVNEELDNIESKLKRIQKANDHAWGATALKTLRQENKLLEKQYDLLKKKKKLSEEDLSIRRKQLEDQGVEFSKDGSTMTNAEARLDELYAEYNAMVDQYNSMSKEQQEDFKKTLESKKDTVDRIEKAMSEYESKFNDYNSLLDELQEKHYELIENAVNRFNHKINLKLELNDAKKEWKKFWHEVVKDVRENDFAGQIAKSMSQLKILTGVGGNANKSEIAQLTKHVEKTTAEVRKQIKGAKNGGGDSIFGDDTKLSMETLTEYRDKLMEAVRSAKEEIENMQEVYLKTLDDAQDKIDKQAKGWESIGDYLEHNVELIKMISGEKAYDLIGKQYEKIYQNNLKTLEADRMSADYWKERVEYYQNMVNTTPKTDKMYETYVKALEKSKENFTSAIEKRNEDLINSLKAAQEAFKNTNAEIADDFSKAMSKGLGLNRMKNQWDLAIEKQNLYLDNVERAIEMQDLLNDFDDVANGLSGRVELQKEFLQFQDEEIGKLKEREKLTQYDIDELRARLEIKKAELALDEARQNKSNLRLRRDSQGNYSYQYTSDEEQLEEAEDKILTAKKDWYELVKKRNQETAEAVMDIRSRMAQAEQDMADAVLAHDTEAWETAHDTWVKLQDMMKDYMGQAEKAKQDFFWGTAQFFSDVENNTMLPMWETTVEQMIDEWDNGGEDSFIGAAQAAIARLDEATKTFSDHTADYLDAAGVKYQDVTEQGIDPMEEALRNMTGTNEELSESLSDTNKLLEDMEDDLQDAIKAYEDLKDAAVDAIKAANSAIETLARTVVSSVSQMNAAISAAESAASLTASRAGNYNGSGSSSGADTATKDGEFGNRKASVYFQYGSNNVWYATIDNQPQHVVASNKQEAIEQLRKKFPDYQFFKSGGYTGEWGDSGRLAVLHQKELVLNESDTSNMLSAINTLRDIVGNNQSADFSGIADAITASAYMSAQVLAQVGSGIVQSIASLVNDNSSINNYKNMTVNADFSGVRSADAIYQALIELDNYGNQQSYSSAPHANTSY